MSDIATMTDQELMFHFSIIAGMEWTQEVSAAHDELTRRGYLYDPRYRDFLTCEQWNKRYADIHPREC